jgi:hypothetical protein
MVILGEQTINVIIYLKLVSSETDVICNIAQDAENNRA